MAESDLYDSVLNAFAEAALTREDVEISALQRQRLSEPELSKISALMNVYEAGIKRISERSSELDEFKELSGAKL